MNETLTLVLDRISKQECPICGITIKSDYNVVIDEYITAKDAIKICKTHPFPNTDSEQQ